jgi:hypothetical protein
MVAILVGLAMLLVLVGGTATLAGVLLGRLLRARQARRHPSGRPPASVPATAAGLRPSGRCSPRRCGWATPTSGPASTPPLRRGSCSMARA